MTNTTQTESEDEQTGVTRRINIQSMRDLIYPRPRRVSLPLRLIFVVALLSMYGCATAPRSVAVEVETVGQLSASYNSIAVAPVHKSTDFSAPTVVDSGDDARETATTVSTVEVVEVPAVAAKTDGVTTGSVR